MFNDILSWIFGVDGSQGKIQEERFFLELTCCITVIYLSMTSKLGRNVRWPSYYFFYFTLFDFPNLNPCSSLSASTCFGPKVRMLGSIYLAFLSAVSFILLPGYFAFFGGWSYGDDGI